jgi:hypothetical protein
VSFPENDQLRTNKIYAENYSVKLSFAIQHYPCISYDLPTQKELRENYTTPKDLQGRMF